MSKDWIEFVDTVDGIPTKVYVGVIDRTMTTDRPEDTQPWTLDALFEQIAEFREIARAASVTRGAMAPACLLKKIWCTPW